MRRIKLPAVLLAFFAGCAESPTSPAPLDYAPVWANVPTSAAQPVQILVDASKDGGGWWFPQAGPFDPNLPHQGKALADHLRGQGLTVHEAPRSITIPCELIGQYQLVVSSSWSPHSTAELEAYQRYVNRGGRLILLESHSGASSIALSFGLQLAGAYWGVITDFQPHPITAGVTSVPYLTGSAVTAAPATTQVLGTLAGLPVMGIMSVGLGQVFFIGDINGIETVPQPFTDNLFGYMLAGAIPTPACPVTEPADIGALVEQLGLPAGTENALMAKLSAAEASLARGSVGAAVNQLHAFINQVNALRRSGRIDGSTADQLILLTEELIDLVD